MIKREKPKAGEFYYHFKKKLYQIVGVAYHSETKEELVVYQALYGDYSMYVRPLEMFMSEVDREKYPLVTQTYRFEKIEQNQIKQLLENKTIEENELEKGQGSTIEKSNVLVEKSDENSLGRRGSDILLKILESNSYREKLELIEKYQEQLTESMLDSIAISMDIYLEDSCIEEKYYNIKRCIEAHLKYEGNRMRF